jgi:hypothetical protein
MAKSLIDLRQEFFRAARDYAAAHRMGGINEVDKQAQRLMEVAREMVIEAERIKEEANNGG